MRDMSLSNDDLIHIHGALLHIIINNDATELYKKKLQELAEKVADEIEKKI